MDLLRNHALALFSVGTALVIGLFGVGRAVQAWATVARLADEGIAIDAEIEVMRNLQPFGRAAYATVSYTVDDTDYTRENRITPAQYEALSPGDTLTLRYDPADPTIALGNTIGATNLTITSAVWLVGALGCALLYASTMRRLHAAQQRNAELWDQAADRLARAAAEIRAEQAEDDGQTGPTP